MGQSTKSSPGISVKGKAVAAAAGAALMAAVTGTAVYIDSDGGGSVYGYVKKYDDLYAKGTKVVVRGACYSSCTMALGYPNACLTNDAVLGFHPAYTPYLFGLFGYKISPEATAEMRRHYPPDALAVINKHGGLNDNGGWMRPQIRTIKATEFPARYRCV